MMSQKAFFVSLVLLLSLSACSFSFGSDGSVPELPDLKDIPMPESFTPFSSSEPLTVAANGTGSVSAVPDLAYVSIGVHSEDADAAAAVEQNSQVVNQVRTELEKWGVEAKDIQTSNFSIYQTSPMGYDYNNPEAGKIFAVDNSVQVTIRDLTKVGKILGASVEAGANNIYSITFDVKDKDDLLEKARQKAFKDAEKQANQYASLAGGRLGRIVRVVPVDNYYAPLYSGMGGGGAAENLTNVPISAGQIQVSVSVQVVFELTYP
jgi:uncharacterized protein YggE